MLRKISKFEVLGIINLLIAVLPFSTLIGIVFDFPKQITIDLIIDQYIHNLVLLFSLGLNIYLGYKLLFKHYDIAKFKQYLVLTALTIFWFIWLLLGYLFAAAVIYPVASLVFIIGIFIFIKKLSVRIALLTSAVTILVAVIAVVVGFEEDYCLGEGDELAVGKPTMIVISAQEKEEVFGNALGPIASDSAQVGTAAYYHFKCRRDFDSSRALQEKYLLRK